MVEKNSGVNPAFVASFYNLKNAHRQLLLAQSSGKDIQSAQLHLKRAEAVFCNQKGLSENGGNLSKEQALAIVDNYMDQTRSWYA